MGVLHVYLKGLYSGVGRYHTCTPQLYHGTLRSIQNTETWWTQVNSRKTRVLTCVCKTCHSSVLNSLSCHIPSTSVTCFLACRPIIAFLFIVTCTQLPHCHAVELLLISGFLHIKYTTKYNTHTHMYMHIMHIHMYACICTHANTYTHTHKDTHLNLHLSVCPCVHA